MEELTNRPGQPLSVRMASAARDLQEQSDPDATYHLATRLAVDNIDGCEAASLSMVYARTRVEVQGSSSDDSQRADELQNLVAEGPCLDALWKDFLVSCPSLADDARWPQWGARVVEETGLQSSLSFRLFSHTDTLGAINMYSSKRDGFDDEDRIEGVALAAHVAMAITASQTEANLSNGLASRTVIGQATGIIMERYGVAADVAFKILVRLSTEQNVRIRDIAAEISDTGRLRGLNPPICTDVREVR